MLTLFKTIGQEYKSRFTFECIKFQQLIGISLGLIVKAGEDWNTFVDSFMMTEESPPLFFFSNIFLEIFQ